MALPKKNVTYTTYISLVSQANTKVFQANPTLAAGDVKVSTDGGAEANMATLPVVTPAGSKRVKIVLSASEMNGDNCSITFSDVTGAEWTDFTIDIPIGVNNVDDVKTETALVLTDTGLIKTATTSIQAKTDLLPTAAQWLYITEHAKHAVPVTFTGGSTTTAVLGNVDGVTASASNDLYQSKVLLFNDLEVADITDYVGATKTATISTVVTTVSASRTALLI